MPSHRSPTRGRWRIPSTAPAARTRRQPRPSDDLVGQYLRKLDPTLVAPVAAFLTHRDFPVSGEIYTVGAGHVARFLIGRTKGFYAPRCPSRTCGIISTRYATKPATRCPADPPT